MKKVLAYVAAVVILAAFLAGCTPAQLDADDSVVEISKIDSIPFVDDQLYAVAYLGYGEMDDISFYLENYLDSTELPIHYFSQGEYYLIIPRYADMHVALHQKDTQTDESTLVFEDPACGPFIIQCNVSDIVPDAQIDLTYGEETVAYVPCISLATGEVDVGSRGLNITE